jgi:iron-sulfur cluster assembly protein
MINLTESAIIQIKTQLEKRKMGLGIRIGVKTTGCSGLSYILEFVDVPDLGDQEFKFDDFSVFVDQKSLPYLSGLTVEFKKEALAEGFDFINPLEKNRCGCGESFTI